MFHLSLKIGAIIEDIEARTLCFSIYEVSNEEGAIFLVHFSDFVGFFVLDSWKKYIIEWT